MINVRAWLQKVIAVFLFIFSPPQFKLQPFPHHHTLYKALFPPQGISSAHVGAYPRNCAPVTRVQICPTPVFFSSCLRAGDQVNQVISPANTRRCNNFHSCQPTDRKWKAESLKSAHPARQRKATLICTCCVSPLA